MRNLILLFLFVLSISVGYSQNLYKATDGSITFFSETPMENIDAVNKDVKALINTKNGDIAFIVANIGFHFKKPLMEEHFNENYMESDKYKTSVYKGKIINEIDYSVDGTYEVAVKGKLNVHGVEKEREMTGNLTVKGDKISITSKFDIKVEDHDIDIPKLVVKNIAETIKVSVKLNFELKK